MVLNTVDNRREELQRESFLKIPLRRQLNIRRSMICGIKRSFTLLETIIVRSLFFPSDHRPLYESHTLTPEKNAVNIQNFHTMSGDS